MLVVCGGFGVNIIITILLSLLLHDCVGRIIGCVIAGKIFGVIVRIYEHLGPIVW